MLTSIPTVLLLIALQPHVTKTQVRVTCLGLGGMSLGSGNANHREDIHLCMLLGPCSSLSKGGPTYRTTAVLPPGARMVCEEGCRQMVSEGHFLLRTILQAALTMVESGGATRKLYSALVSNSRACIP